MTEPQADPNVQPSVDDPPHPPHPVRIQRRLSLYHFQWLGLALLMLIVLLALIGVFGETVDSATASTATVDFVVNYPSRFRYKMIDPLEVRVTNRSDTAFDTATVAFERAYIHAFSTVTFTPAAATITGDAYQVELNDIAPGETRVVTVQLQAEHYGQHTGAISLSMDGGDRVEVSITTLVFP